MSSIFIPATFPAPVARLRRSITAATISRRVRENTGPIEVEHLRVRAPLKLQSLDFDHRLTLRSVVFEEVVDLRDCKFAKTVDLRGCCFRKGLILEGTRFTGSLLLGGAVLRRIPGDPEARSARCHLLRVRGDLEAQGLRSRGTLDLTCCEVQGNLDLCSTPQQRTKCTCSVLLNVAKVGGNLQFCGARIGGNLSADAATISARFSLGPLRDDANGDEGEVLTVASVAGDVSLAGARVVGYASFSAAKIGGRLNLQAVEVGGGLFCRTVQGHRPRIEGTFYAPAAQVSTTLDLSGAEITHDVVLQGAQVSGNVIMGDGWSVPHGKPAYAPQPPPGLLNLSPDLRTSIGGSINLNHATVAGQLDAVDVCVRGSVSLDSASFTGRIGLSRAEIRYDLRFESAVLKGGLYCRYWKGGAPRIDGSIEGSGAQISSGLHLSGVRVEKDVKLVGARIEGSVEINNRDEAALQAMVATPPGAETTADGSALARLPVRIGGTLDFGHATLIGPAKLTGLRAERGISLDTAVISGYLDLSEVQIAPLDDPGEMDNDGASAGVSPLSRARARTGSLNAVGLHVTGYVRCHGMRVLGNVDLQSTRIEGGLECCARVTGTVACSERPVIGGSVLLRRATILRDADFRAAWIGGDLSLERASVTGMLRLRLARPAPGQSWRTHLCTRIGRIPAADTPERRLALSASPLGNLAPSRAAGGGGRGGLRRLFGRAEAVPTAILNLRNCTIQYLDLQGLDQRDGRVKKRDGHAEDVSILLEGCQFHELSVPGKDYRFLFRRKDGAGFRQSNYEMVERWLRNQGNEDAADRVYRQMRRDRRQTLPFRERLPDFLLGAVRDVAMGFQWLMLAFAVVLALSVFLFHHDGSIDRRSAVQSTSTPAGQAAATLPARRSQGHEPLQAVSGSDAFVFALQSQLPMLKLPEASDWKPTRRPIPGFPFAVRYDQYTVFLALLGYLMVPLVIGGIASTWLQRRTAGR